MQRVPVQTLVPVWAPLLTFCVTSEKLANSLSLNFPVSIVPALPLYGVIVKSKYDDQSIVFLLTFVEYLLNTRQCLQYFTWTLLANHHNSSLRAVATKW